MVTTMLDKAFATIPDGTGLILHSDQGWQYQHKLYQRMLKAKGIRQSMPSVDSAVQLLADHLSPIGTKDMLDRMVQAGQAATAQMQVRTASGYARASSGSASVETAPVTQSHTQYIYFEQPMQAPDEIARALRIQQTYGLAGAR